MAVKPPIIYVTREIERALGMPPSADYRIVTNRTPYSETIKNKYPDFVTLVESPTGKPLGTGELLDNAETAAVYEEIADSFVNPTSSFVTPAKAGVHGQTANTTDVNEMDSGRSLPSAKAGGRNDKATPNLESPVFLVFKNTARIEAVAKEHGWRLIDPPAETSEQIENKLSQVAWLGELASYLPPHSIHVAKSVIWKGVPFVMQWAHGHTGGGTMLVDSEELLKSIQTKFPERRARITDYVPGSSFTVNVAVTERDIAPGNVSYQITGLPPFTDAPFATIGNDWGVIRSILSKKDMDAIDEIAEKVGTKMRRDGWRGLFGIDLIKDDKSGRLFLIEINARQPASAPFESSLQEERRHDGALGMTIFEAHIAALRGEELQEIIPIDDGAQIVQRVTNTVKSVPASAASSLGLAGYQVISYANTESNADLLRIQSMNGIMAGHNEFNEKGKKIGEMLADK